MRSMRPQLALSCIPRLARVALPADDAFVSHAPLQLAVRYHPRWPMVVPLDEVAEPVVEAWPTALSAIGRRAELFRVDGTLVVTTQRLIGVGIAGTTRFGAVGERERALLLFSADRSEITSVSGLDPDDAVVAFAGGSHRLLISRGGAAMTLLTTAGAGR